LSDLFGYDWFYEFRQIPNMIEHGKGNSAIGKLFSKSAELTKNWSIIENSKWICRNYLAMKMIFQATLNLNAAKFAEAKNLRAVIPYLKYYAILALSRGIAYTDVFEGGEIDKLLTLSHSKARSITKSALARFDSKIAKDYEQLFNKLKANREIISYRSPTSGDFLCKQLENMDHIYELLADIIQLNSEVLERSMNKNTNEIHHRFDYNICMPVIQHEIEEEYFFDNEDGWRLDYIKRKIKKPLNVLFLMTEGHVEDFFGSWCSGDDEVMETSFNPDLGWNLIFDIP
jgi:hypothetical protein